MSQLISNFYNLHDYISLNKVNNTCSNLFQNEIYNKSFYILDFNYYNTSIDFIPVEMYNDYTINGLIPVSPCYLNESAENIKKPNKTWSNQYIKDMQLKNCTCGPYFSSACRILFSSYSDSIVNKTGMVIGSQSPWAEAALLSIGSSHIITIEYTDLISEHPLIYTMTPNLLAKLYINNSFEQVDYIFSYSSIEHDGLGRYDDPLNPFGDIETMNKLACLLKDDGLLFLAIPIGIDTLIWNANRRYGWIRLNNLFNDWIVIDVIDGRLHGNLYDIQPIWILKKKLSYNITNNFVNNFQVNRITKLSPIDLLLSNVIYTINYSNHMSNYNIKYASDLRRFFDIGDISYSCETICKYNNKLLQIYNQNDRLCYINVCLLILNQLKYDLYNYNNSLFDIPDYKLVELSNITTYHIKYFNKILELTSNSNNNYYIKKLIPNHLYRFYGNTTVLMKEKDVRFFLFHSLDIINYNVLLYRCKIILNDVCYHSTINYIDSYTNTTSSSRDVYEVFCSDLINEMKSLDIELNN